MKKLSLLLVSLLCISVISAGAQGVIIKGGYNYSNVDINKSTTVSDIKKGKSGWQIGVGYQSESSHGFSIQPEIIYKVTGYKFSDVQNLNLGYVEVPVNVQWGPDLLIARPFIFAGPYVGLKVSNQFRGSGWEEADMQSIRDGLKKAEWGLGVGLGIQVFRFQITGKYNWNFGAIADTKQLPTLDAAPRTFEICLGLKF